MSRRLEQLAGLWAGLGGGLLLLIAGVTAVNVGAFGLDRLARLVGHDIGGLVGYEDFVALAVGAAVPMFLPYCQCRRGHLTVDLLADQLAHWGAAGLAGWFRRWSDRLAAVLVAGAALFLAWWMVQGMIESRGDGAESRVLGWPVWPFFVPGIVSLGLWALVALVQLFEPAGTLAEAGDG